MKNTGNQSSKMDIELTKAYVLNGVNLIPHYLLKNTFVQPGHTKKTPKQVFTSEQLEAAGGVPISMALWPRGEFDTIEGTP